MAMNAQLMELLGSYDQLRHEMARNHVEEMARVNATAMALLAAVAEALAAHQQAEARAAQMVPSTLSQEVATIDWWVWANTIISFITACLSFRTTGACALLMAYGHNLAVGRHQIGLWAIATIVDPIAATMVFIWMLVRKVKRAAQRFARRCRNSRCCPCCAILPITEPAVETDADAESWVGEALQILFGPPLGATEGVVEMGMEPGAAPPPSVYRWILRVLGTGIRAIWRLLPAECESRTRYTCLHINF